MQRIRYEKAPEYTADAYKVKGEPGIAWTVLGWEVEAWSDEYGEELGTDRTGRLVCIMIGDDKPWVIDTEDLIPIKRDDYCGECGQVGCCHDGR